MNLRTRYPIVSLGEIITEAQYGTAEAANGSEKGMPILRMNNITVEGYGDLAALKWIELAPSEIEKFTVRRGDLLFNRTNSRELVGKTAVWDRDERFAFAGYLVRVRFDPNKAIPEYVSAFLNSAAGRTLRYAKAKPSVNMSNISASDMRRLPIPLAPLEEQKRIADILDKADAIRRKRQEAIRITEDLCISLFEELFGNVVKNDRGWPTVSIAEAGEVQLGRQRSPEYQTGRYTQPYLRVANVFEDRIDLSDLLSMDFDEEDFKKYRLEVGDILLNEGQSTELVGRPALWQGEPADCCFQNTLVRFRVLQDKTEPEYALSVFLAYLHAGAFARISSKTSSVVHRGAGRFGAMPFPLPPIELQRSYAKQRKKVRQIQSQQAAHEQTTQDLFDSLVQRAFRGKL